MKKIVRIISVFVVWGLIAPNAFALDLKLEVSGGPGYLSGDTT